MTACWKSWEKRAIRCLIGGGIGLWLVLGWTLAMAQQLPPPRSGQPPLAPTVIEPSGIPRVVPTGWSGSNGTESGSTWVPNVPTAVPAADSSSGTETALTQLPALPNPQRTDSTVTGIRPLTNWSGSNNPDPQAWPNTPTPGGTTGGNGWQSSQPGQTAPGTNLGAGSNQNLAPVSPAGSGPTSAGLTSPLWNNPSWNNPAGSNPGVSNPGVSNPGQVNPNWNNPAGPLVPLAGGETLATGTRMLPTDQVDRQRAAATIASRQSQIAGWDAGIALPEFSAGTGLRQGRPVRNESENTAGGYDPLAAPALPQREVPATSTETSREVSDETESSPRSRAERSMDQFSWWLMMCSVLANAILFYFLYDSRAKYLDLADELQARFFRER